MHEFGHGLYEDSIDPALERTPLCARRLARPARVAEPDVGEPGRPQPPVLRWFYPRLAEAFPAQLGSVEVEDFYRAVNKVEPTLIRVEADEVTYNLHVILRFELEQEIVTEAIALARRCPRHGTRR